MCNFSTFICVLSVCVLVLFPFSHHQIIFFPRLRTICGSGSAFELRDKQMEDHESSSSGDDGQRKPGTPLGSADPSSSNSSNSFSSSSNRDGAEDSSEKPPPPQQPAAPLITVTNSYPVVQKCLRDPQRMW